MAAAAIQGMLPASPASGPGTVPAAAAADFVSLDLDAAAFDLSDRGVAGTKQPGPLDAFLWTDRGIYRPGEVVHLTALLRDNGGGPVTRPARLRVLRPNGQVFADSVVQDGGGGALSLPVTLSAGAGLRLPPGAAPSLPLALGGATTQLRTLARLYAALATDGASVPLRLRADMPPPPPAPLLQPSAARLVAEALTREFPQGGPAGVAWKIGTSWGGRDAWALGFDAGSVAGVWLGRPDGTALPGATGLSAALPVLAQVFALLPPAPRDAPPDLAPAPVSAVEASLRLLFPPPDATLSADGPVPIRVMGGRRPVTFLVDGVALASSPASRSALWQPDGAGFYTLSAQDADGAVVRARVRVK
jgi:membrane carboxypeptidase/penicillin-binding protein PbpC